MCITRREFLASAATGVVLQPFIGVSNALGQEGGGDAGGDGDGGGSSNYGMSDQSISDEAAGEYFNQLKQMGSGSAGDASLKQPDFGNNDLLKYSGSFSMEAPPPPSPVTASYSMFDRHSEIIQRWAASLPSNPELVQSMLDNAKNCALTETQAYVQDKKLGDWSYAVARGNLSENTWKCNVFIAEMAVNSGMEPMYGPDHAYANTSTMLSTSAFQCWSRADPPQTGDLGVYANHVFIVENPSTGLGISALRTHVTEMRHFTEDAEGRYRASSGLHPTLNSDGQLPEVIFFRYNCPDLRSNAPTSNR
ncbi:hypothetical protein [Methylocapsa sp. S129]|uniref:hypothetical protein n=1 Tax=Methylocapsa sp. S129 TaxID=1641869 RepID=UPI00131B80B0|nr:hypothetical protein [Methylocapsa sp. S129]